MVHFLEKKTDNIYRIHIVVKPNAKKQSIEDNENTLLISLRSKPIQNKANKELINLLKHKLKLSTNQIALVSGLKGTNKAIQCEFSEDIDEESIIHRLFS